MYSEAAVAVRRCKGRRKDGEPCRAWAVWGDPKQLCVRHLRGGRGPDYSRFLTFEERMARDDHAKVPPCRCGAYRFAHRPGSGRCRWPDTSL